MKIVFTGGGTAGHALANKILIPFIQEKDSACKIIYIGSHHGMEKEMISPMRDVAYYGISVGKLRRYFSLKNGLDFFRVLKGVGEAFRILRRERPQLIYSGGGYVAVPVVWAAALLKIPVVLRETDVTMGLANRLCLPFAREVCVTFPDTAEQVKTVPCYFPGMLVRPELFDEEEGEFLPRASQKPVCLVMGGSQGAVKINEAVWSALPYLTRKYQIIHICGKGNCNNRIPYSRNYRQLEYTDQIGRYYALADVVLTRCGSNSMAECLSLGKRTVCIPMGQSASRGEQEKNAMFALKYGNSVLLKETDLNAENLIKRIQEVLEQQKETPFQRNRGEVVRCIRRHAAHIWAIAFTQLKQDMTDQIQDRTRINMEDLSDCEVQIMGEISDACEDYDVRLYMI